MESENLRSLARIVVTMGEQQQVMEGQFMVLSCAVLSLLETHPDHQAFAQGFRRSWMRLGSHHSNPDISAQTQAGISRALAMIEELANAPLNVRPPRGDSA